MLDEFLEKRRLEIGIALVGLLMAGAGVWWWRSGGGEQGGVEIIQTGEQEDIAGVSTESAMIVDIEGAVMNPGIYKMSGGGRVGEAVELAGGLTQDADTKWIEMYLNKASKVRDGMKVYIPRIGDLPAGQAEQGIVTAGSSKVININLATQSELEDLPGVGEVTAGKIISGRPYGSVEELKEKKIISSKVFELIKDRLGI
ncbi:hypothetical protein A2876_03035 [Candidatus Amesbacteria bacterium RIFCSPHIGHO2_01_FULL_48_32b]|uniref:Soluble ligand binding domain-containing protein n=1 Tax=Candidatus Amesbacteria bacterium RIFCSPHIGHO2_01_FULL_48_32b TaxID=1797253 RepID=A0A1F4YFE1_9BACT|nr:MAG: hypothetical protein A2876_03035 [Candidatus Amesbacteria bacterium RIFCSPHIGHO2_01_FULL_48_32b]